MAPKRRRSTPGAAGSGCAFAKGRGRGRGRSLSCRGRGGSRGSFGGGSGAGNGGGCRIEIAAGNALKVTADSPAATAALRQLGATLRAGSGSTSGSSSWQLPLAAFAACCRALEAAGETVERPPSWALVGLGAPLRQGGDPLQVPKKTGQVLLRDVPEQARPTWWRTAASWPTGAGWPVSLKELRSRGGQQLLPYQLQGVGFGLANGGRVLIGDEMGLGKTVQALALTVHYVSEWPLLVVCPSSLCRQWHDEAAAWLPEAAVGPPGVEAVQVLAKGSDVQRRLAKIFVVSYDLLSKHPKFQRLPSGAPFKVVVCDEAHFLKSPESQRTKAIAPLIRLARRSILLTGTPAVNNAAELHTAIDCLLPGLVPSWNEFVERYCNPREVFIAGRRGRPITKWEGSRRPEELHLLLRSTVMIRRLKADVLAELPSKRRQRVRLDPDQLDREIMNKIGHILATTTGPGTSDLRAALEEAGESGDVLRCRGGVQAITELSQLTCQAKEGAVRAYVEYLVQAGCRFLLFAHHQFVLDYLEDELKKLEVRYIRIDGTVAMSARKERVEQFQTDENTQVALLSITACGQGLNLQSASTVVFAELFWVVGQMLQAEDRVHRVGQRTSVNVHYLVAPDTLDDIMHMVLNRKHKDTTATLDGSRRHLETQRITGTGAFAPAPTLAVAAAAATPTGGSPSRPRSRSRSRSRRSPRLPFATAACDGDAEDAAPPGAADRGAVASDAAASAPAEAVARSTESSTSAPQTAVAAAAAAVVRELDDEDSLDY
eukprot:TRINITY_DN68_c2_g2_i1.p1 TRINITY_DN68_c2_g2~~TRINITY_DN68_c2_g2_i1.p1  ORF type:complete len:773 (+),score=172.47 TRINITY_DN68_c2_g2_i1:254-2572(+)